MVDIVEGQEASRRIKCSHCFTTLKYKRGDIHTEGWLLVLEYITCPACQKKVHV